MSVLKAVALFVPAIRRLRDARDGLLAEVETSRAALTAAEARARAALGDTERLNAELDPAQGLSGSGTVEAIQLIAQLAKCNHAVPDGLLGNRLQTVRIVAGLHAHFAAIAYPQPPPEPLQRRVVGGYVPQFMDSAFHTIHSFNAVLAHNFGRTMGDYAHVFDFGVGCGRIIRRVAEAYPTLKCTGGDIDAEAIAWLDANYGAIGEFVTLPHQPPSSIADGAFDLVYGVSVFTHLPEDMQFAWLEELRRVTTPGAVLLLTVHGENYLRLFPQAAQNKAAEAGGFFYNEDAGLTSGLPEFYKNAYHTQAYVEKIWSKYFEIIEYRKMGLENHQDLIVCRRR